MPALQGKLSATHHDRVVAVVVAAHSDADFLRSTLAGLAAQSVSVERVLVAVPVANDAEAGVQQAALPADFLARCVIVPVGNAPTFGSAVAFARKRDSDGRPKQAGAARAEEEWLWLLHADSTPLPEALENLLATAEKSAKIGVVGPKYVAPRIAPTDPYYVREVGIRATRSARRVPETRELERDQGQFDSREDVLAVGSAGMLVRTRVWEELNGFNPNLGPFGDGLEFSRRVHLAGYRVVVAPTALLEHHGRALRPDENLAVSYGARRRAQIFNALLAAPTALVVPLWLGYIVGAIPRALMRLAWRDSVRAAGEVSASLRIAGALGAVLAGRRAIARLGGSQSALRALEASPRDIHEAKRALRIAEEDESAAPHVDPLVLKAAQEERRAARHGAFATLVISALCAASINIRNFAAGTLIGGVLAPSTLTADGLWQAGIHGWLASGDGSAGTIDAYWLAWLPAALVGAPWGVTLGMLLTMWLYTAPVVAALLAYLAAGRFTRSAVMRTLVALLWIVSPTFLEALAQGRVAGVSVHALLPLALFAVVGAWREGTTSSSQRAHTQIGLTSLTFAALAVAAPIFVPLAIVLSLLCVLVGRSGRKRWLWVPVPAIAVLLPAALQVRPTWRAWVAFAFSEPGVPVGGAVEPQAILRGFTTRSFDIAHPDLDWLLFIPLLVIVVLGMLAALRPGTGSAPKIGWGMVSVGLALALCSAYVPVAAAVVDGNFVPAVAWHGVGLSLAWLGLAVAIARGSVGIRQLFSARTVPPEKALPSESAPLSEAGLSSEAEFSSEEARSPEAGLSSEEARLSEAELSPEAELPSVERRWRIWQLGYGALAALLPLSVLSIGGWWAVSTALAPTATVHGAPHVIAPALAVTNQTSPERSRVLALNPTANGLEAEVWRYPGLQLQEYTMAAGANRASAFYPMRFGQPIAAQKQAATHFDPAEANLAMTLANVPAAGQEVSKALGEHAISVVLVRPPQEFTDSQARSQLIADLNAVPGLEYVTNNETGAFWRVSVDSAAGASGPTRLRLVDSESGAWKALKSRTWSAHDVVAVAPHEQILVLAERADGAWKASLNGVALERADQQKMAALGLPMWAQAWKIPTGASGDLNVWHSDWVLWLVLGCAAVVVLVGVVAALPIRQRKEDVA
ncbi:MAG: glycosyltransferase [Arcanobacterium sp.]|nr:glycosyltransferase [Arcanobacterium sp.]